MTGESLLGGDALEYPYHLTDAVLRVKTDEKMHVVLVVAKLLDLQIVAFFNTLHSFAHGSDNLGTQQSFAVLQGEDQVVVGVVDTVITFGDGHTISIAAYERNLRFPSYSPPPTEPVAEATGKGGLYLIDEFCQEFEPKWRAQRVASGLAKRNKPCRMSLSEILTIIIHFHQSNHRNFKHYYLDYVCTQLRSDFPRLVSYTRFLELMSEF